MTRRQFLMGLLGLTAVSAATGLYTLWIEPRWVEHVRLMMPFRHLPPHLNGSTLVQISDLHISDRYNWNYQINELRRVQSSRPDFIVYTGDFITYRTNAQFTQLAQLLSQRCHLFSDFSLQPTTIFIILSRTRTLGLNRF